jgi:hypothetical protein
MSKADYCECDYDGDSPEFYNLAVVKARKTHHCYECDNKITPGEQYTRRTGKWNGDVETYRECRLCSELREWAEISVPCFCANVFGTLHERVRAMVEDAAPKIPGFFMEYGRRMVKIRQRKV